MNKFHKHSVEPKKQLQNTRHKHLSSDASATQGHADVREDGALAARATSCASRATASTGHIALCLLGSLAVAPLPSLCRPSERKEVRWLTDSSV